MITVLRNKLHGLAKTGCAVSLERSRLASVVGSRRGLDSLPLVVGYHRVVEDFQHSKRNSIAPMLVSSRTFEEQLEWIGKRYRFVSLDELAGLNEENTVPAQPVAAITFDDGYQDVYHHAFPILKRKGIPFAVFVVSDLLNTSRLQGHDEIFLLVSGFMALSTTRGAKSWLEVLAGCESGGDQLNRLATELDSTDPFLATRAILGRLDRSGQQKLVKALGERVNLATDTLSEFHSLDGSMLREMVAGGATIGSHTRTHALLPHESDEIIRQEVEGSRQALEQDLGLPITHFAYPDGRFDSRTVTALVKAGYRTAYTVCRHRHPEFPQLTIPRTMLWENTCMDHSGKFSPAILHCQVNGIFNPADRCRSLHLA